MKSIQPKNKYHQTNNIYNYIKNNFKFNFIILMMMYILIIFTIKDLNINHFEMSNSGLSEILPYIYYIVLIGFSIQYLRVIRINTRCYINILLLILFIFVIYGTPLMIETTPRFGYTFRGAGIVEYIERMGEITLDWNELGLLTMYQNWPAMFFLGAIIKIISNISILPILTFTPVFSRILFALLIYLIIQIVSDNSKAPIVGSTLYIIFDWINQDYFCSQNLGYLLFIILILLFFKLLMTNKKSYLFAFILCIISITTAHGLSSITALAFLSVMFGLMLINKYLNLFKIPNISIPIKTTNPLIVLIAIIFISWSIFGISSTMIENTSDKISSFKLSNTEKQYQQANELGTGSEETTNVRNMITQFKIYYAIFIVFFGGLGFLVGKLYRNLNIKSISFIILFAINLAICMLSLYGNEGLIRCYFFSLLSLIFFILFLLDNKYARLILIIFIVISIPIHITLHYNNESFDYYSEKAITGANFFYSKAIHGSNIIDSGEIMAMSKYDLFLHNKNIQPNNYNTYHMAYNNTYLRNKLFAGINNPLELYIFERRTNDIIYNNGEFIIYI